MKQRSHFKKKISANFAKIIYAVRFFSSNQGDRTQWRHRGVAGAGGGWRLSHTTVQVAKDASAGLSEALA